MENKTIRPDLLAKSLKFATKRHKGQFRDGVDPLPYITHPVDVVNILRYEGSVADPAILAAGFMHDLVEETETTVEEIEARFGSRVAGLVSELTRDEPSDEVRASLPEVELWGLRSQLLLDGIARMSRDAQTVKLADRVSNLRGSKATREGWKLERYITQSRSILERIARDVCPSLWDLVERESSAR